MKYFARFFLLFFYLVITLASTLQAADLSFLEDFVEAFRVIRNGPLGISNRSCSGCSGSLFAKVKCPHFAQQMITEKVKYGGIFGWFNNEERLHQCVKEVETLNSNRLFFKFPSRGELQQCLADFHLEKLSHQRELQLMQAMQAVELYNRYRIELYKRKIWAKKNQMGKFELDRGLEKYQKQLSDKYRAVIEMQSCFDSDINCHSPERVLRSIPNFPVATIKKYFSLDSTEQLFVEQGRCLIGH